MNMSYKITERSLYQPIANVLSKHGIECVGEVSIQVPGAPRPQYPDLVAKINDCKFIIEVKIDGARKLLEVTPHAFIKAQSAGAQGCISILFPSSIRQIHPDLLNSVAPQLEILGAIISLPWITGYQERLTLEKLARLIAGYYKLYLESKRPTVSYDSIVKVARESVIEVAKSIRQNLITRYINYAMDIVGRFDLYRATLEDFKIKEEEMKAWIADIAAYLTISQILFYHILSQKRPDKYPSLPDVNPLVPDAKLLETLRKLFTEAAKEYEPIFGPDLLSIIERSGGLNSITAISKYVMALKALKPEHVKEELLGRLYQESIPSEARKNLGAFFTKPKAATILATLAIDRWDEIVLDPACGSGTLLTETYLRRKELAPGLGEDELHKKLLERTYGIDVMHFAYHMTSINLLIQNIKVPARLEHIRAGDGIEPMINACDSCEDPPQVQLTEWLRKMTPEVLPYEFLTM
jgi:Holliday junction resolvase